MTKDEIDEAHRAWEVARALGRKEMLQTVLVAWNARAKAEQATSPNKEGWYALNRLWHVITAEGFGTE